MRASAEHDPDLQLRLAQIEDDPQLKELVAILHASGSDYQPLARLLEVLVEFQKRMALSARALPGDNSVIGTFVPGFFRHINELVEREAVRNTDGLSIQGVLEGSAVAYAYQMMHPDGGSRAELEAELATLEPVYQELYTLTAAQVGDRVLELMLPAVALALCYAEPHHAYGPMLSALSAGAPEAILENGRKIAASLPTLPQAGAILGTAIEVRRGDDSYRVYDAFIEDLQAEREGVDAYAVLAEPAALRKLDRLPFVLATKDSFHHGAGVTHDEMLGRTLMMSFMLRVASRRREETALLRFICDYYGWEEAKVEELRRLHGLH
jgi:hypothetical protein